MAVNIDSFIGASTHKRPAMICRRSLNRFCLKRPGSAASWRNKILLIPVKGIAYLYLFTANPSGILQYTSLRLYALRQTRLARV